jgi:hypothetical protein
MFFCPLPAFFIQHSGVKQTYSSNWIALENFANLYREMGRLEDAVRLETKALNLF